VSVKRGKATTPRPVGFKGTRRKVSRYGWVPDLPDPRDVSFAPPAKILSASRAAVDLRAQCPAVYDQGRIGSCTANAIAAALEFEMMKQGMEEVFTPSRLFIYYNERLMEGTVSTDAGAQIRDGIKSVASQGDCPETEWPYDDTPPLSDGGPWPDGARAGMQPPQSCYDDALKHVALLYQSVDQNLADMKACLTGGSPFVFGFTVFPSFETDAVAKTGNVPMPGANEAPIGGHAVTAVGYDDDDGVIIVRNSWGDKWGDAGYFYMPYAYLLDDNLADDFWTISLVQ
jgi:C1A family cysteine protease